MTCSCIGPFLREMQWHHGSFNLLFCQLTTNTFSPQTHTAGFGSRLLGVANRIPKRPKGRLTGEVPTVKCSSFFSYRNGVYLLVTFLVICKTIRSQTSIIFYLFHFYYLSNSIQDYLSNSIHHYP